MSKKKKSSGSKCYDILRTFRNDWGMTNPVTKTFKDKRKKKESKYSKQFLEKENE